MDTNILVVDFGTGDLEALDDALRNHQLQPFFANNREEVLYCCQKNTINAVLLSVDGNGEPHHEIVHTLRSSSAYQVPILFFGYGKEGTVIRSTSEALAHGGDYFFRLPCDLQYLAGRAQAWAARGHRPLYIPPTPQPSSTLPMPELEGLIDKQEGPSLPVLERLRSSQPLAEDAYPLEPFLEVPSLEIDDPLDDLRIDEEVSVFAASNHDAMERPTVEPRSANALLSNAPHHSDPGELPDVEPPSANTLLSSESHSDVIKLPAAEPPSANTLLSSESPSANTLLSNEPASVHFPVLDTKTLDIHPRLPTPSSAPISEASYLALRAFLGHPPTTGETPAPHQTTTPFSHQAITPVASSPSAPQKELGLFEDEEPTVWISRSALPSEVTLAPLPLEEMDGEPKPLETTNPGEPKPLETTNPGEPKSLETTNPGEPKSLETTNPGEQQPLTAEGGMDGEKKPLEATSAENVCLPQPSEALNSTDCGPPQHLEIKHKSGNSAPAASEIPDVASDLILNNPERSPALPISPTPSANLTLGILHPSFMVPDNGRVHQLEHIVEMLLRARAQRTTGVIRFGQNTGVLLAHGEPGGLVGSTVMPSFIRLLADMGRISESQARELTLAPFRSPRALAQKLAARNILNASDVIRLPTRHLEDSIVRFLQHRGAWQFNPINGDLGANDLIPQHRELREWLIELIPRAASKQEIETALALGQQTIRVVAGTEHFVPPADAPILELLDGYRSLEEAARLSGIPPVRALAWALVWLHEGLAERVQPRIKKRYASTISTQVSLDTVDLPTAIRPRRSLSLTSTSTQTTDVKPAPPPRTPKAAHEPTLNPPSRPKPPRASKQKLDKHPKTSTQQAPEPQRPTREDLHTRLAKLSPQEKVNYLAERVRTQDYFGILGIDGTANRRAIDEAHQNIRSLIPDPVQAELETTVREVLRSVDEARDILIIPELRAAYEHNLSSPMSAAEPFQG